MTGACAPPPGRDLPMLTVALSKGRICHEATPLLARAGIDLDEDPAGSRRLCITTSLEDVRVLVLRAQDVPTFVEHGAADLGITGKDVLLEHRGAGLYEPLDLGVARCRLVLASRPDAKSVRSRPRVATKYVETTRRFFAGKGVQAEIIRLLRLDGDCARGRSCRLRRRSRRDRCDPGRERARGA